jgi:hypothetical protein
MIIIEQQDDLCHNCRTLIDVDVSVKDLKGRRLKQVIFINRTFCFHSKEGAVTIFNKGFGICL